MSQRVYGIVLCGILVGCGGGDTPDLGTVEGTVTLDNEPLPGATVSFRPADGGRAGRAITDDDGWYELLYSQGNAGTPPGKYTVSISTATVTSDEETGEDIEIPEKVPQKYNVESELQVEVVGGSNTHDFSLESEGEIYQGEEDTSTQNDAPICGP